MRFTVGWASFTCPPDGDTVAKALVDDAVTLYNATLTQIIDTVASHGQERSKLPMVSTMHSDCMIKRDQELCLENIQRENSFDDPTIAHQYTQLLQCQLRGSTTAQSPQLISMTTIWIELSRVHLWGLKVGTVYPRCFVD
ncbi:UNVERIFIED_CONTAM: hypothetical protein FKN15_042268 [Acipenser sinensis]